MELHLNHVLPFTTLAKNFRFIEDIELPKELNDLPFYTHQQPTETTKEDKIDYEILKKIVEAGEIDRPPMRQG